MGLQGNLVECLPLFLSQLLQPFSASLSAWLVSIWMFVFSLQDLLSRCTYLYLQLTFVSVHCLFLLKTKTWFLVWCCSGHWYLPTSICKHEPHPQHLRCGLLSLHGSLCSPILQWVCHKSWSRACEHRCSLGTQQFYFWHTLCLLRFQWLLIKCNTTEFSELLDAKLALCGKRFLHVWR